MDAGKIVTGKLTSIYLPYYPKYGFARFEPESACLIQIGFCKGVFHNFDS